MNVTKKLQLAEKMLGEPLYPYQVDYIKAGSLRVPRLSLKGRQTGLTTIAAVEAAIDTLAHDNYLTLIISQKEAQAADFLDLIKYFIFKLGEAVYKDVILKDSYTEILTKTRGRVKALSGDPNNARGYTANHAIIDEAAFIDDLESLLNAVEPATELFGTYTMITTPNGHNDFYGIWGNRERLGYWSQEVPWSACPRYTREWAAKKKKKMDLEGRSFAQEYECKFTEQVESMWKWERLESCLTTTPATSKGIRIMGYDPSVKNDMSGVCILQVQENTKEVIHLEDLKGMPIREQAARLMALDAIYGVKGIYLDAWGIGQLGKEVLLPLWYKVHECLYRREDKLSMMGMIRSEAESQNFFIRVMDNKLHKTLMSDLFSFNPRLADFPRIKGRKGSHGDLGMALMLAWKGASVDQNSGYINQWLPSTSFRGTRGSMRDLRESQRLWAI